MSDILGPADAANAVTTRIAETRVFPTVDTWFRPCSTPGAQDGTQIQSLFLNGLLAQLRAAIRGNGKMADGITPVIAENNANDAMLLGAIQALIQRGQTTFAIDTGTTDALVIAPSPAVTEYKAGMRFVVLKNPLVGANTTPAPTIAVSGLAPLTVTKPDASALGVGDLKKTIAFELLVDGLGNARIVSMLAQSDVAFQIASQPHGLVDLAATLPNGVGSGVWTVPAGVFWAKPNGSAGGGAGGAGNQNNYGWGGAGGGQFEGWVPVFPGQKVPFTVGPGGTCLNFGAGTGGGATSFGNYATANGGQGGPANQSSVYGTSVAYGGTATGVPGIKCRAGANGGAPLGPWNATFTPGAGGAPGAYGSGGIPGSGQLGQAGNGPGAGGAGGASTSTPVGQYGGPGNNGALTVEY